ncbi:nucleotidyltransferase family protein [Bradyrhizobium sp. SYSU BS000235]|uniref:nucleotidyltransferase family protein n=1 Tax=Bradyrhizobium sp. SYSU BS000235 TaxID=3411332 RepID=UPI003C728315
MSLISLANQTLTTPALMDIVERYPESIPQDVCLYVREIFERNADRNNRLSAQLAEALTALNQEKITPVLLKGSAMLVSSLLHRTGARLISDLDLLVSPAEAEVASNCLRKLGYDIHYQAQVGAAKWYADLKRPGDAGMIDLHQKPPGHGFFYELSGDVTQNCRLLSWRGTSVYIPSSTYHALMLIVHDQFQDADYWVGKIDLRHLLDLRDFAREPDGIDWKHLAFLAPGKLARHAMETQLIALSSLLGVDVPPELRSGVVPRIQHRRRMLQIRLPALSRTFLLTALLDYRNYRAVLGVSGEVMPGFSLTRRVLPRLDTARFLLGLSREQRAGKV